MSRFETNHVTLILALLGILLCTFEPKRKKKRKTSYMAFERQTSDGRQIEHLRNGRDEGTYTFLTTMYHGISSMRSLERSRNKDGVGG